MTIRHTARITTTDRRQITTAPQDGSTAAAAEFFRVVLTQSDDDALLSFELNNGWAILRPRNIEAIHITDPDEADALADCGDQE